MTGPLVVRLAGLVNAAYGPSPFDGLWLVEYDPRRAGVDPNGRPMTAHIVAVGELAGARRFGDIREVHRYVYAESGLPHPMDKPLAAFTREVMSVTRAAEEAR